MIRKAQIKDIKAIYKLLNNYGEEGLLLSRPLSELYDHLRDFSVYVDEVDATILGCCALQICWDDLAEIRSLAVHPDYTKLTIGSKLIETVIAEAKSLGINQVFALTYQPDFFKRFQFEIIDRSELPLKIWGGCLLCVKFPDCDETAMMKKISS